MNWLQKIATYYYKGKTEIRVINNLGGGKVLVDFGDNRLVSIYRSQVTSRPVFAPIEQIECPECQLLSKPRSRRCEHCKTEF